MSRGVKQQEWRWCVRCLAVFRTRLVFCPFDDWYLSATRPAHIPTRSVSA